jgi:chromosome segregation ATPase
MTQQLLEAQLQLSTLESECEGLRKEIMALKYEDSSTAQESKHLREHARNSQNVTAAAPLDGVVPHSKADFEHESTVSALRNQLHVSQVRLSELEAQINAAEQQLLQTQQQVVIAERESNQYKGRMLQLQRDNTAATASAEMHKADTVALEATIAEMKAEIAALQDQGGGRVNELSTALAASRQKSLDQTRKVGELEAELREARARIATASQEHAADRGLLQEELRRVTEQANQLKVQVASLKTEYERSLVELQSRLSDISIQNVKLEAEARSSELHASEALRREKNTVASLSIEVDRLKLEVANVDEDRSKLMAAAEAARSHTYTLDSSIGLLRRELAALKQSGNEVHIQAALASANHRCDESNATVSRLESDIQQLTTKMRLAAEEHARCQRDISLSLDEQKRRTTSETTRCKSLEDNLKQLQLQIDTMVHVHAQELETLHDNYRRTQSQMQAQCDKLLQNLVSATTMTEHQASAHARIEHDAASSQAVADMLRKHIQEAQASTSEQLQRCNELEVKLSSMAITIQEKALENDRLKHTVAMSEANIQEKMNEIQKLHEKIANGQREADARLKDIQQRWDSSEERAAVLQGQLHEVQRNVIAEKSRRSSDELIIGNYASEVKMLTATAASLEQQLRAKETQLLHYQEHLNQLQQNLHDADAQKAVMQQQLDGMKHDIETNRVRSEVERSQLQTAHAFATSGLMSQVIFT